MRSLLFTLAFALGVLTTLAQSPFQFNFQAVARDLAGNPLQNEAVDFRLSILQGSDNGTAVYIEELATSTNNFGLANLIVGSGTPVLGSLSTTDWANGPYFLQIELDIQNGDGFQFMGTSAMASVPYALHAKTSEEAGPEGPQGEAGVSVINASFVNDSLVFDLSDGTNINAGELPSAGSSISQGVRIGYSSSSSWVCPEGVTQITIELWGGGGGSGSSSGYALYSPGTSCFIAADASPCSPTIQGFGAPGGEGGNGGYTKTTVTLVPGETYDISVGSGGVGGIGGFGVGVNSGTSGENGEFSQFLLGGDVLAEADGGFGGGPGTVACCPWPAQTECPGMTPGVHGTDGSMVNYDAPLSTPDARSYIPVDYMTPVAGCCAQGGTIGSLNSEGWLNHSGFGGTATGLCNSGGACINLNNCAGDDVEVSPYPGIQGEAGFVVIVY